MLGGPQESGPPQQQDSVDESQRFSRVLERKGSPKELRPNEDRRSTKTERQDTFKPDKPEPKVRKTSEREAVMLNFMDSMESEFGITPTRMLEALAVLDSEELTRPPEETASDVIANLQLAPEEEPRAMELYLGFLQTWKDTAKTPTPQPLTSGPVMTTLGAAGLSADTILRNGAVKDPGLKDIKAIPTGPERREQLNQSLDRMNAKFFMQGPGAREPLKNTVSEPLAGKAAMLMNGPEGSIEDTSLEVPLSEGRTERPIHSALAGLGLRPEFVPNPLQPALRPDQMFQVQAQVPAAANAADQVLLSEIGEVPEDVPQTKDLETLLQKLNADPMAFQFDNKAAAKAPQVLDVSALQVPGFGAAVTAAANKSELGAELADTDSESKDTTKDGGESQSLNSDFSQLVRPAQGPKTQALAAGATGAFAVTDAEAKANLEALKDQTQMMVHKGGGEARIKFSNADMGEVQLKVQVREGRVNIEFATDNQETKKLLESSIADLKSSLSGHKLSVDSVKVDIGQSHLSDSQRGMDFQQDMARQQARQMMSQFRDETASRRDPFFEMSGIKAYGRKRADLDPIPAAGNTAPRRMSGRGDRMNLVA